MASEASTKKGIVMIPFFIYLNEKRRHKLEMGSYLFRRLISQFFIAIKQ